MKTLEEIKDEVAIKHGFDDWKQTMHRTGRPFLIEMMEEVAHKHAKQMCEHQKQICNDNAVLNFKSKVTGKDDIGFTEYRLLSGIVSIHSNSILNAPLATDNK